MHPSHCWTELLCAANFNCANHWKALILLSSALSSQIWVLSRFSQLKWKSFLVSYIFFWVYLVSFSLVNWPWKIGGWQIFESPFLESEINPSSTFPAQSYTTITITHTGSWKQPLISLNGPIILLCHTSLSYFSFTHRWGFGNSPGEPKVTKTSPPVRGIRLWVDSSAGLRVWFVDPAWEC